MRYHVFIFEENTTRFLKNLPRNDGIIIFYNTDTDKAVVRDKIKIQKATTQNVDNIFTVCYTEKSFNDSFVTSVVNQLVEDLKEDDIIVLRPSTNKEYWDQIAMELRRQGRISSMRKARDTFYDNATIKNTKTSPVKAPQKPVNAWAGFSALTPPTSATDGSTDDVVEEKHKEDNDKPGQEKTETNNIQLANGAASTTSILDILNADAQNSSPVDAKNNEDISDSAKEINPNTDIVQDERDRFIEKVYDVPEPDDIAADDRDMISESDTSNEKGKSTPQDDALFVAKAPEMTDIPAMSMNDVLTMVPKRDNVSTPFAKQAQAPSQKKDETKSAAKIASQKAVDIDEDDSEKKIFEPSEKFMRMLDEVRIEDEIPTREGLQLQVQINKINGDFEGAVYAMKTAIQTTIDDVLPEIEVLNVAALLRESETVEDFESNFKEYYGTKNARWKKKIKNNFETLKEKAQKIFM